MASLFLQTLLALSMWGLVSDYTRKVPERVVNLHSYIIHFFGSTGQFPFNLVLDFIYICTCIYLCARILIYKIVSSHLYLLSYNIGQIKNF